MAIPVWWSAATSMALRMVHLLDAPRDVSRRQVSEIARTVEVLTEQQRLLGQLLDEQAALRRVATLVAQGEAPGDIFTCVAEEIARISHVGTGLVIRFEPGATATVVATSGTAVQSPANSTWPLDGDSVAAVVRRTGRPARIDGHAHASDPDAVALPGWGFSSVAAPIVIDDRLWGAAVAVTHPPTGGTLPAVAPEGLSADAEERLADLADLIATAISNADARAQVTASRARVVATADAVRRRLERDLHDGIQQRLVSLALALHTAAAAVPATLPELRNQLSEVETTVTGIIDELREVARGIHPAILSEGGLHPALRALARRAAVPVELDVHIDRRMPEQVEIAAYYVVSEALTNAAKHAGSSVVRVDVDQSDGLLKLSVHDDGVGGADAGRGSGLIGLEDRVEAVGGKIRITSPPGRGTSLHVTIPIELP